MTIRKNFLFEQKIAEHLEQIAKAEGKMQSEILQEAIEERYKKIKMKKNLEALMRLASSLTGKIGNVDAKEARYAYVSEKYANSSKGNK